MQDEPSTPASFLRTLMQARNLSSQEQWDEAIPLWEAIVEQNPVEADFSLQLADAYVHAGSHEPALAPYQHAFELGAGFPFDIAYAIAVCEIQLGHQDAALGWLERAFSVGYRDLDGARADERFADLRGDHRYRALVALIDAADYSRDEGWRYDLQLFAREVKRKAFRPFWHGAEADFDAAVSQLDRDIPELSDQQIVLELNKLLRRIGDGHAIAYLPLDHPDRHATLPLQFFLFEEGLFITASEPQHAELLGHHVLKIGDHTVDEVFAIVEPTITRDNDQWLKQVIPHQLRVLPELHALNAIDDSTRTTLTLADADGVETKVELAGDSGWTMDELWNSAPCPHGWRFYPETLSTPLPRYLRNQAADYWFDYLAGAQTIYFQFNRVRNDATEKLHAFTTRLFAFIEERAVEKLVIDIRWNNGGNTFLTTPLLHQLIGSPLNQHGRLFVIIGRRTFSAAQNFASMLDRHTAAIFVGEPTGASPNFVGEDMHIELPYSKVGMNVSDLYWQSSWPMDYRTWIAPLLYLPPTFAAYQQNRDPALEAILAWREYLPGG